MDFLDVVKSRRSCRLYKNEPINMDLLKKCILLWMNAPSARNEQPWKFFVLTDRERLDNLWNNLKFHKQMLLSAPCAICIAYDPKESSCLEYTFQSLSACAETILLSLVNYWLWWCRLWTYPIKENCDLAKEMFNLPEWIEPFTILSVWIPEWTEEYKAKDCEKDELIKIL